MSLRSINTILERSRVSDWTENPNIDGLSSCILIAYDKLPINNKRVLLIGTNKENFIDLLAQKIKALKSEMNVTICSHSTDICFKFFNTRGGVIPTIPFLVVAGTTIRLKAGDTTIPFTLGSSLPKGFSDPFPIIAGLGKKYGIEIVSFDPRKTNSTKIANSIFS